MKLINAFILILKALFQSFIIFSAVFESLIGRLAR